MNILFVCEGFDRFSVIAQPWKHVYEIAKRLKCSGSTVCILTDYHQGLPTDEEINGIPIQRIKRGRFFLDSNQLVMSINRSNADIINWVSGPLSAIYFWRLRNQVNNNIVWTIYKGGVSLKEIKNIRFSEIFSLHRFYTNILYSIGIGYMIRKGSDVEQVKKIIVWSERLKKYLINIGIKNEKIRVISSGVDTKVFRPTNTMNSENWKESLGFDRDDVIFLYFGPLSSFRGADTIISAMSSVVGKIPSANLILLARESQYEEKHLYEIANNSRYIRLITGIQKEEMIVRYLSVADIVVLPFRFLAPYRMPTYCIGGHGNGETRNNNSHWSNSRNRAERRNRHPSYPRKTGCHFTSLD